MTAAGLVKPTPPASAAKSWRQSPGARLAWLHARSRRVPAAVLALAVCGALQRAAQLTVTGASLNGGILTLARNVLGLTGIGLATSLATGGLLAWTLPLGYLAFAQYALLQAWRSPWLWPVRPPADRGAWICACLLFAAGLLAFTVRGPRTSPADHG